MRLPHRPSLPEPAARAQRKALEAIGELEWVLSRCEPTNAAIAADVSDIERLRSNMESAVQWLPQPAALDELRGLLDFTRDTYGAIALRNTLPPGLPEGIDFHFRWALRAVLAYCAAATLI